ncbi:hypothetical protein DSM106972_002870 [Dulcicalothrix desertica PCC 7102]|uniref:Uncharacterized protein n=1 Tax=Dulcicalothrix desertica PCC 7102 TaxID=232991 RepID=A0A433VUV4_9CYAN|nr:hypothetical protein [Dulcicalothrix desertica]RUT09792.1 hypothetical protein DSM106972_002870 [Dulcicalothrix desertica PCC 7102]TWH50982.1 hypothetical protein CAL7102_05341 [Dulcicalothrix desertica PCC 7102]
MITQMNSLNTGIELDDLAFWHAHVNSAIEAANNIGTIFGATARIIYYAFWLANQKAILTRKEFKKILSVLGWLGEEKIYLKIACAFAAYEPHELAQIEPRTIFLLAGNLKRYQCVIDQFHTLTAITQDGVRDLIASTRQSQTRKLQSQSQSQSQSQPQPQPQPQPSVWHYAADGGRVCQIMIYDEKTGVMIEQMAKSESRTFQYVVGDSVELRQAYIDGRLIWASDVQQDAAPIDWSEEEYEVEGAWTFEVDEKDYDIENVVEEALAPAVSNDSDKQGVEKLIEVLQTAPSWQEVSVALKDYEEFKLQAWETLTPVERHRVVSITPIEVRKLSQAKRNGKIIDFCEIREDVYKVQYSEYIFGEIIYKDKLNDFLARL